MKKYRRAYVMSAKKDTSHRNKDWSIINPYKDKPEVEESIRPFISDYECLCMVTMDNGVNAPDYACTACNGTGKARFLSKYEKDLKRRGTGKVGYNMPAWFDWDFTSHNPVHLSRESAEDIVFG